MPQRKRPRSRRTVVEPPPDELGGGAKLDPTDLMAGLILVFAIPALVFVGLDFAGMPLGGPGKTAEQAFEEKEERKRRQPPLTSEEVKEQLAHFNEIVDKLSHAYIQRCRQEEDPRAKHRWWKYAKTSLGWVKSELDLMLKPLQQNAELASFVPRIQARINEITQLETDLEEQKVFVDN